MFEFQKYMQIITCYEYKFIKTPAMPKVRDTVWYDQKGLNTGDNYSQNSFFFLELNCTISILFTESGRKDEF